MFLSLGLVFLSHPFLLRCPLALAGVPECHLHLPPGLSLLLLPACSTLLFRPHTSFSLTWCLEFLRCRLVSSTRGKCAREESKRVHHCLFVLLLPIAPSSDPSQGCTQKEHLLPETLGHRRLEKAFLLSMTTGRSQPSLRCLPSSGRVRAGAACVLENPESLGWLSQPCLFYR